MTHAERKQILDAIRLLADDGYDQGMEILLRLAGRTREADTLRRLGNEPDIPISDILRDLNEWTEDPCD